MAPTVFTGKDGNSMRDFLDEFETYVENKYDGNEQQQSQILAQFLDGPARRAYEAMDESRMRYSHLYAELLLSERISLRDRSESDFRRARPGPHDLLKIYAIHLQRLASRAVPESLAVCERQLCHNLGKLSPVHSSTC